VEEESMEWAKMEWAKDGEAEEPARVAGTHEAK
jgi:hypothetical protein